MLLCRNLGTSKYKGRKFTLLPLAEVTDLVFVNVGFKRGIPKGHDAQPTTGY